MQHSSDTIRSGDGLTLFYRAWRPGRPRASLVLSHGYAEHSGRYAALAGALAKRGFAVYAPDHRGHGHSQGERANVRRFGSYARDLRSLVTTIPKEPRFLLGHSMGGAVAALLALEHPRLVHGLILSGAFLENATRVPPVLLALSGVTSRLLPSLPTLKLDTSLLSRDPEVVRSYESDPLIYTGGTKARLGAQMLAAGAEVLRRAGELRLPTLILHGAADRIADPAGSHKLYARLAAEDKTLKLYDGFYHEIFNEPGKERVVGDVLEWLEKQLGKERGTDLPCRN